MTIKKLNETKANKSCTNWGIPYSSQANSNTKSPFTFTKRTFWSGKGKSTEIKLLRKIIYNENIMILEIYRPIRSLKLPYLQFEQNKFGKIHLNRWNFIDSSNFRYLLFRYKTFIVSAKVGRYLEKQFKMEGNNFIVEYFHENNLLRDFALQRTLGMFSEKLSFNESSEILI